MKKFLALLLSLAMVLSLAACGGSKEEAKDETQAAGETQAAEGEALKIAMITDYGDITDQSFNQTTYEACKAWAEANGSEFNYYKPAGDTTPDRVAMIETAIDEDYNVIVMPGYAFAGAIQEAAPQYPDIKFVALDVSEGDYLEAGVGAAGEEYDYNPANWTLSDYVDLSNVYTMIYQEELPGYMAGYAAVKLGYTKLGFLGGMAVPAVIRYGYGFIQGADAAAEELGVEVSMKYAYGNQFYGDADITGAMDTWYQAGTEVVFACGGGIFTSAAEAAAKVGGKVIGVDVDQSGIIDEKYGEGMTVTSAMKGLAASTKSALDTIYAGEFGSVAGKIDVLGLVSDTDMSANFVQIPLDTTQFNDDFTADDYVALVAKMVSGELKVNNDITIAAADNAKKVAVEDLGNLK